MSKSLVREFGDSNCGFNLSGVEVCDDRAVLNKNQARYPWTWSAE